MTIKELQELSDILIRINYPSLYQKCCVPGDTSIEYCFKDLINAMIEMAYKEGQKNLKSK